MHNLSRRKIRRESDRSEEFFNSFLSVKRCIPRILFFRLTLCVQIPDPHMTATFSDSGKGTSKKA
jgi:hypothetical protein